MNKDAIKRLIKNNNLDKPLSESETSLILNSTKKTSYIKEMITDVKKTTSYINNQIDKNNKKILLDEERKKFVNALKTLLTSKLDKHIRISDVQKEIGLLKLKTTYSNYQIVNTRSLAYSLVNQIRKQMSSDDFKDGYIASARFTSASEDGWVYTKDSNTIRKHLINRNEEAQGMAKTAKDKLDNFNKLFPPKP